MLKKTHLALGLAIGLTFYPFVNKEFLFLIVTLIASILPDIDSSFSSLGRRFIFRPVQMMTNHRGILHTYTFCILITVLLAFFYPVFSLPFFIGYSFHLFADSFTVMGIKPFWPFKMVSKGVVRTGGKVDFTIFIIFALIDFILIILLISRLFG